VGSEKKIVNKTLLEKEELFYIIVSLVACCYIPRQRYLSTINVRVTYAHCVVFVFDGQFPLLPFPSSLLYSSDDVETP
jgi:hypothetical protein